MEFIMGIDTGGTYTDCVIIERSSKRVLHKAKALTTKEDLTIGIQNCIEMLNFFELDKIALVNMSTTLATNAIVEGKGCTTGLILIGGKPEGKLPADQWVMLQGKFDIKGRMTKKLQDDEIEEHVKSLSKKVRAIAISGYASVRNPAHELYVKRKVREISDMPVVCAHELTSSLGFYERTVTAILNARLIPIIDELIQATKAVLQKYKINAPIMIVKGDGSLMNESLAKDKPIETILSGPAASIIGGTFLTKQNDAIILDMGGTTTDIANLQDGTVKIRKEGAKVGGWLTRVKAAEICTFGIGGDSYLHLNPDGRLEIGPQKVWPLCVAGKRYPNLTDELKVIEQKKEYELCSAQATDCFMLVNRSALMDLNQLELDIVVLLEENPHSLFYLANKLNQDLDHFALQHLIDTGTVARISITPTDVLHVQGRYNEWDRRTAEIGAAITAGQLNKSLQEFLDLAVDLINTKLSFACLQSLVDFEKHNFDLINNEAARYLIEKALEKRQQPGLFQAAYTMNKPIVTLGAPAAAWMAKVAEKLGTTLLIPEHSEVANAVGAAVGEVMETVEILIRPDQVTKRFIVYAPWIREGFDTQEKALDYAISSARQYASAAAQEAGSNSYDILEIREDIYTDDSNANIKKNYIETRIKAVAVGKPAWKE